MLRKDCEMELDSSRAGMRCSAPWGNRLWWWNSQFVGARGLGTPGFNVYITRIDPVFCTPLQGPNKKAKAEDFSRR